MTHLLARHPVAAWLEDRMSQLPPLPPAVVRVVGVVVVDSSFVDPDTSARTSWIGDGTTVRQVLDERRDELDRYDAVVAVTWPVDRPEVTVVIVNP
jgi:hypothetical protein